MLHNQGSLLVYSINYAPEVIGVGKYCTELVDYLSTEGMAVDVVTAVPHYPGWRVYDGFRNRYWTHKINKIRVCHCPIWLARDTRGIKRALTPLSFALSSAPVVFWRILRMRPDTVLCLEPTLFAAPVALLAAKLVGSRTVLHAQDLEVDAAFGVHHLKGRWLHCLANAFDRWLLGAFDGVVTISKHMGKKILDKGLAEDRLVIIRNWINLDQIRPLNRPSHYRSSLNLSEDRFVALYAGNIGVKQGLHVLCDAAEMLVTHPRISFVVVGDGPEKAGLMARYGHIPNLQFLPIQPTDKLCELLNLADVHILPQDRGAADLVLPSKLGGMLASGKACIVMADPETELYDFLEGHVELVPSGDSRVLSYTIATMARDPQLLHRNEYSDILSKLDSRKILPKFKAFLENPRVYTNASSNASKAD